MEALLNRTELRASVQIRKLSFVIEEKDKSLKSNGLSFLCFLIWMRLTRSFIFHKYFAQKNSHPTSGMGEFYLLKLIFSA